MYGIDLPLISSIGHKRWVNNEINLIFFLAYTIFATYLNIKYKNGIICGENFVDGC